MYYAEVCPALPVKGAFTYSIPEGLEVKKGCRVKIPFGRKKIMGYVIEVHRRKPSNFKVKEILENYDEQPIFDDRLIKLAEYCAENYFSEVGEVLQKALPSGKSSKNRYKIPYESEIKDRRELSESQQRIYENIIEKYEKGQNNLHLLYGVTGSGKTEVYVKLAEYLIKTGKSIIYLVPEITLSSQIYKRLLEVFNDELVIYHSRLTPNQKLDAWKKFYSGDSKIVIGTRSAVFMQAPELGMIIVDEEHDSSFKENSSPRYNARRLAVYRNNFEGGIVLFGSATPSLESLYAAEKNVLNYHEITERFGSAGFPEIEIVELDPETKSEFSTKLKLALKNSFEKRNQSILLLNRRGYSPVIMCGDCKSRIECPDCSIGMNLHNTGILICHYCGFTRSIPEVCPQCGSENIVKIGSGTQKIEENLNKMYPNAVIKRLDQDTASKKDAVSETVKKMEDGGIDILLGTQMVSKGFDFKKVETVGIILADIGLNMPDFRSSERIFALLMQVIGRSGRGEIPGRVIIQTLNKNNSFFKYLLKNDYLSFYREELELRKMLNYPPFSRILRFLIRGVDETLVTKSIDKIHDLIETYMKKNCLKINILGPAPAPFSKISKNYRHHIIIKSPKITDIRNITHHVKNNFKDNRVYLEIDIDPVDLL